MKIQIRPRGIDAEFYPEYLKKKNLIDHKLRVFTDDFS